ncbi:MAG: hypothetical protein LBQ31_00415 [Bacteroidales bacterium]|nr:hypothetical protein [Bacteroidales bacterium]
MACPCGGQVRNIEAIGLIIYTLTTPAIRLPPQGRAIRSKVASKRGQRTRLRGLCRARATSLRSNNLLPQTKNNTLAIKTQTHSQPLLAKGFPLLSLTQPPSNGSTKRQHVAQHQQSSAAHPPAPPATYANPTNTLTPIAHRPAPPCTACPPACPHSPPACPRSPPRLPVMPLI